MNLQYIWM